MGLRWPRCMGPGSTPGGGGCTHSGVESALARLTAGLQFDGPHHGFTAMLRRESSNVLPGAQKMAKKCWGCFIGRKQARLRRPVMFQATGSNAVSARIRNRFPSTAIPVVACTTSKAGSRSSTANIVASAKTEIGGSGCVVEQIRVFGGNGNPELVREICDYIGVPWAVDIRRFSNENLFIQIQENVREADVFVVQPFSSPVHENIMELLIMMDALRSASARGSRR